MMQCLECGFVFNEPCKDEWWESWGEHWIAYRCPDCGSDDIAEVNEDAVECR